MKFIIMITFQGRILCRLWACLVIIILQSTFSILHSKELTDTIPLTFEYNMPVVKALINGQERRFLLDTGSSASILMLGTGDDYVLTGDSIEMEDAHGEKQLTGYTQADFRLGRFEGKKNFYFMPYNEVLHGLFDGILGMDYLEYMGVVVKIDVKRGHLILTTDKRFFNREKRKKTTYKRDKTDRLPKLKVKMSPGGKVKNVLFDTGFNEMLELRMEDFERLMNSRRGEDFRQQLTGTAYGGNQGTALQQRDSVGRTNFRLKEMKALKTKLYDIDAHAEETTDSKLGAAILNHGAVIINARKRKIYFLPAE